MEMLLTGKFISAREAMAHGLVNCVAAEGHLEQETWRLAREIAQYSLVTLGLGKQAFYQQMGMAEGEAYHYAREVISANALMSDAVEGMSAFFEKRAPVWKER